MASLCGQLRRLSFLAVTRRAQAGLQNYPGETGTSKQRLYLQKLGERWWTFLSSKVSRHTAFQEVGWSESAFSGRFENSPAIYRWARWTESKSVKRTAEKVRGSDDYHSAVRFTDYHSLSSYPQQ